MLEKLLRAKAEAAVLGVVLFSDGLHLREIARRAGVSPPEAKKELDNLAEIGLLTKTRKGNLSVYFLNRKCPFLGELKGLYAKTEGVIPLLAKEFRKVGGLKYAFMYGSFASGEFGEKSDVDVLGIGSAAIEDVEKVCFGIQKKTLREINYALWSESDFRKKLREGGAFVNSVLRNKKIWLAGDENEFERVVEKRRGP